VSLSRQLSLPCPRCSRPLEVTVWTFVDGEEDPHLKDQLLRGELNTVSCSECGPLGALDCPVVYLESSRKLCACYVTIDLDSEDDRHRLVRSLIMAMLDDLTLEDVPQFILEPILVPDLASLAFLAGGGAPEDAPQAESQDASRSQSAKAPQKSAGPQPTSSVPAAVHDLIKATSDEELFDLIGKYPELVSPDWVEKLEAAAEQASEKGREDVARHLAYLAGFLEDAVEAMR